MRSPRRPRQITPSAMLGAATLTLTAALMTTLMSSAARADVPVPPGLCSGIISQDHTTALVTCNTNNPFLFNTTCSDGYNFFSTPLPLSHSAVVSCAGHGTIVGVQAWIVYNTLAPTRQPAKINVPLSQHHRA